MMKSAVAVNGHGKIVKVFSWASDELIAANTASSDIVLELDPPQDRSSYWDFAAEEWISVGSAPSQHHTFDYEIKQWQDNWVYSDYLAQAIRKAKNNEIVASTSGFNFNGVLIQSDAKSQMTIASIIVVDAIEWITADNSLIMLSKEDFDDLKLALSSHLQATRTSYNDLKTTLSTYSLDQLKAYCL